MVELKPGWCILHPGEREPCRKCNSALRRVRAAGALVVIGIMLAACDDNPSTLRPCATTMKGQ